MSRAVAVEGGKPSWYFRVHPIRAARELWRIRKDPEDLVAIARFFFWIGGHDDGSIYRRILRDPEARRVLDERIPLPPQLIDLAALRRYPRGTLAHHHAENLERNGLDPAQIDADTRRAHAGFEATPEHDFIRVRTRTLHDLIHTLTGYGIDTLGEGAIVAFTCSNLGNRGYGMMALFNSLTQLAKGEFRAVPFILDGFRRGRRARFLWGCDWETLLGEPLEAVRERLGIDPIGAYEEIPFPHRAEPLAS